MKRIYSFDSKAEFTAAINPVFNVTRNLKKLLNNSLHLLHNEL